jgi:cysteine-rich repeat protein
MLLFHRFCTIYTLFIFCVGQFVLPFSLIPTTYALNPPIVTTAEANGSTFDIHFDDALDTGLTTIPSDFSATGSVTGICSWSSASFTDSDTVQVTMNCAFVWGETITVDYTNNSNWIQDLGNMPVATFISQSVTNNTPTYGCMSSDAINYNPSATLDDGSCYFIAIADPADSSTITSWNPSITWWPNASSCEWSFDNSSWISNSCDNSVSQPQGGNRTLYLRRNSNTYFAQSSFLFNLSGCTSTSAVNHNPDANIDDGSCVYPICGNSILESSYDNSTVETCDDGNVNGGDGCTASCQIEVLGCTSTSAINFNPSANYDDGSCTYPQCGNSIQESSYDNSTVETCDDGNVNGGDGCTAICHIEVPGCTYGDAINYTPGANLDDGSCIFIHISSPLDGSSVVGWNPSINWWPNATTCEMSTNGSNWSSMSCDNAIPEPPSLWLHTLYLRRNSGLYSISSTFTYDLPGCMSPDAINYDPNATIDDGSCYYISIFNPANSSTITWWSPDISWWPNAHTCQWSFDNSSWITNSCDNNIPAPNTGSQSLYLQRNGGIYLQQSHFTYDIHGCTDSSAINYNPLANISDSSCMYPTCGNGIQESSYDNSTVETCDDGNVNGGDGCTASCQTEMHGCTDSNANNYDFNANYDNGSCVYITLLAPTQGSIINTWAPSINWWTAPTNCEWSFDNTTWTDNGCTDTISDPGIGNHTLYLQRNGSAYLAQSSFSYSSDFTPPTFSMQLFSDFGLTLPLADNVRLKTGTYYIQITSDEPLAYAPQISISAEGTANDINATTTFVSGNIYRYTYTVSHDVAAIGAVLTDISITGVDILFNSANAVNPTNESLQAPYTDTVADIVPGTPDMTSWSDSGSSSTDNNTSDTTPDFTVSCVTGSTVTLYDNITSIGTGICAGSTVTITASTLSEGLHASINATQTDTAGNVSAVSSNLTVTIDTTVPTTPSLWGGTFLQLSPQKISPKTPLSSSKKEFYQNLLSYKPLFSAQEIYFMISKVRWIEPLESEFVDLEDIPVMTRSDAYTKILMPSCVAVSADTSLQTIWRIAYNHGFTVRDFARFEPDRAITRNEFISLLRRAQEIQLYTSC